MAFGRLVEIGLLKHERHPEHALPEIDRCLPVGSHERDVVYTLALELLHGVSTVNSMPNKLGFCELRRQAALADIQELGSGSRSYLTAFSWARRSPG
jgi:hypothetical protein